MKTQILSTLMLLFSVSIFSQEVTVKTKPKAVTLFLQKAKVTESVNLQLKKGRNLIRVTDLPYGVDINTYNIALSAKATLLSITPENKKAKAAELTLEQKAIKAKQEAIALKQKLINAEISAYTAEKDLINSNKTIDNKNENWSPSHIETLSKFYLNRLLEINKTLVNLNENYNTYNKELQELSEQFNKLNPKPSNNNKELVLEIFAKNATSEILKVTYIVNNAGWQPFYDVRVSAINKPLDLITKGKVYQNTGKDWKNITLKVSTYLPRQSQNRPILNPFYVKIKPQIVTANVSKKIAYNEEALEDVKNSYQLRTTNAGVALSNVPQAAVLQQQLSVVYELKGKLEIASNSQGQTIILDKQTVPATYKYHAVPKLTNDVFLLAHISNWQNLNLMLTEANIYFEDSYVGKTTINPNYVKPDYPISLGADNRITIKRNLIDNKISKVSLSSKLLQNFEYEIRTRNSNIKPIEIEILDQLPIVQDSKIHLYIVDLQGGNYDKNTGSILWKTTIKQGKESILKFKYTLKYPKDITLQYY